jgi:DNA-binding MarR family transcriptional regulator
MSYADCIVFLLAKAYQKSQKNLKQRLRSYGLTSVQALILETLWEEDGLTASLIAKRLTLDNATVSGVLERLAEGDWIVKQIDHADKRMSRIFLSDKAHVMEQPLTDIRNQTNDSLMTGFSMEERVVLKRLLKDFQRN